MSISKSKKSQTPQDIDTLKLDVASFASSIGLSSSSSSVPTTNAGFNDSDFRKTGPIKPNTKKPPKPNSHNKNPQKVNNTHVKNQSNYKKANEHKPKHSVVHPLSAENSNSNSKGFDKFKNYPKLPLMKASSLGVWYEDLAELEVKVMGEERKLQVKNVEEWKILVEKNRQVGERLLAQYVQDYEATEGQKGDVKLLVATQRSGTAADKVSAFSVMVEENPIANMRSLDALLALVTAKVGKRHAFPGFDALKELFISRLLPDRKLKSLLQRPMNHISESKDGNSLLLFWYWEECLKQRYERFIVALEEASRDMLPELKDKALKTMSVLLRSKSEQERRLLAALVNKLGDPQKKGASNAGFHLTNILAAHPNMKAVVIDEVDSFLFRPHLGLQSKYHAVNFLTEIRLSHKGEGPKVAKRLIDVYFALFKVLISEAYGNQNMDKRRKGDDRKASNSYKDGKDKISSESHIELDSRLLSALLTGVNRAFPYVSSDEADDIIEVQTPMLFQLVHSKNFNVGVQALMLLDKISSKNQIVSDRFYRALYSKLLLPAAMNSSKAEMFIGLLLRAMKSDVNLKRASAFSKRLLQIALQQPSQYACGFLFLLSEVLKARPPLWNMVLQNESNDDDLEHFDDVVEETENELLATSEKPQSSNGFLHVDNDVDTDAASSEDQDDAPTHHSEDDVPNEADDFVMGDSSIDPQTTKTTDISHGQQPQVSSSNSSLPGGYNPRLREPSFCNADRVSWWELTVLASHAHPSVATMAKTLLSGANIVYNGNPLNDLSLPSFLDKFMEKKPKQSTWHGASQIEPAKKLDMNNHLIGPEILSLAEIDVPPEDLVFHKFYANKMSSRKKPKKKKKKKGAGDEAAEELFGLGGGNDESDNEEIDNMLDSTDPALDADGVYDYDDLDQVANEEDDDLIGDVSDADIDLTSADEGEEVIEATAEDEWSDDNAVSLGDDEDDDDSDGGEDRFNPRKQRRKPLKKTGESPFASLEDYEHLLDEDSPMEETKRRRPKPPLQKKKKKKQKSG